MKLYKISRTDEANYDEYRGAIVAAKSKKEAAKTHPSGKNDLWTTGDYGTWVNSPDDVKVAYIGVAASTVKPGVILADFKAG